MALSIDHKPSDELEKERIENAGGFVEFNRVNGNLALSRALGDFAFKTNQDMKAEDQVRGIKHHPRRFLPTELSLFSFQVVSGCPDIQVKTVNEDWDYILLACDGIWDVLSNQEVADFVTKRISQGMEPDYICEQLMTRCLATDCTMGGLGCDLSLIHI